MFLDPYRFKKRAFGIVVQSLMVVSCDDIITLVASFTGAGAPTRFEWVQMTGTPVTWLEEQNQLSVMFQQPPTRDDKVFRFYVNRGTSSERYSEVLCTAVPRDTLSLRGLRSIPRKLRNTIASEQPSQFTTVPGFSPYGQATINNPARLLQWSNPQINYLLRNYVTTLGVTQSPVQVGLSTYFPNALPGSIYNVTSVIGNSAIERYATSSNVLVTVNPAALEIDSADKAVAMGNFVSGKVTPLQRITRQLLTIDESSETANMALSASAKRIITREVITRQLTTIDETAVTADFTISIATRPIRILQVLKTTSTSLG